MCVIMLATDKRPSPEMIAKAYSKNGDGAGVAWREKSDDGLTTNVVWRKGLKLDEIQKIAAVVALPAVFHFRIASCGGIRASLTHPFVIDENASTFLSGKTNGYVLFHNGHWGKYKEVMAEASVRFGKKIPDGKFSDTRAIAWLCYMMGVNYMEMIEEKGIAFSGNNIEMFWGTGWYDIEGVYCSNTFFTSSSVRSTCDPTGAYSTGDVKYTVCLAPHCLEKQGLDLAGHCSKHSRQRPDFDNSDDSLPVINTRAIVVQPNTGGNLVKPTRRINMTPLPGAEAGGSQQDSPFVQWQTAQANYQTYAISHKQFKRARRTYEAHLRKVGAVEMIPLLHQHQNKVRRNQKHHPHAL